ncbi:DNA polymerase alpha catalytic subunit [Gracilariopsis chorda]|uniref:DNA polymerase alpha catalytic subunit n=1 Tax=Gracilariopsis chorda TaxID=448386 RepID=A0A2V3IYJ1_9FLOR|nr:DNA polymerase alpha catalytic subunit [Gracilariopsis chorda]|eukprot:PXF47218.1 DNA polymerase alpha catalytic subunit [Gracilariopsis chorda]
MQRVLYVLPRQTKRAPNGHSTDKPVEIILDVYHEVSNILLGERAQKCMGLGAIAMWSGSNLPTEFRAKKVVRSCPCGDTHAPREPTDYLEVRIPYEKFVRFYPESSGATLSSVEGTLKSSSEALCMKWKLRGPGWIQLNNAVPSQARISHAKFTLSVASPNDLLVPVDLAAEGAAPVSALCVSTKTVLSSKAGANEVVMISGLFLEMFL